MRSDFLVMPRIRDELERVIIDAGWFPGAPFHWIGLMVRYGLTMEAEPHFEQIDETDGELPLAIEVDMHRILELDTQPDRLKAFFKTVVVRSLLSVARRYELPTQALVEELE